MSLVPWRGDVFMLLNCKPKPPAAWWARKQQSWASYERYFDSLDPAEWKQQDLYRILRLENKRYFSTLDEIVKSYRVISRRFHPDKRPGGDPHYPSVIRASNVLMDPASKRAFDSVDPALDDFIPTEQEASAHLQAHSVDRNAFFDTFRPVFERNAHWSVKQPVPVLGDWQSPDEHVDNFYRFWFDFDSWREYSFLDKEDKSQGHDRYERKAIEKSNRQERQKRRTEELRRISELVSTARKLDPRLQLRERREELAKQRRNEERMREAERKELERRRALKAARQREMDALREQMDEEAKLQRLVVELTLQQSRFRQMALEVYPKHQKLIDKFIQLSWPSELAQKAQLCVRKTSELLAVNERLEAVEGTQRRKELKALLSPLSDGHSVKPKWTVGELETLVKSIKAYPPGTKNRWSVIHRHMLDHGMSPLHSEKDVMEKSRRINEGERFRGAVLETRDQKDVPWTAEEQTLLERGLREFPASAEDRWDKISTVVQSRTKAECFSRYQHIVDMLKNRRQKNGNRTQ